VGRADAVFRPGQWEYGAELWCWWRPSKQCRDRNVVPGGFHHPGCDMAECPICTEQQLMCGCRYDEDGPDDDA
jgi:hypothetical protein